MNEGKACDRMCYCLGHHFKWLIAWCCRFFWEVLLNPSRTIYSGKKREEHLSIIPIPIDWGLPKDVVSLPYLWFMPSWFPWILEHCRAGSGRQSAVRLLMGEAGWNLHWNWLIKQLLEIQVSHRGSEVLQRRYNIGCLLNLSKLLRAAAG